MATGGNPIKEAALAYSERGFRVIPLHGIVNGECNCKDPLCDRSAGKHPTQKAWHKQPRIPVEHIDRIFLDGGRRNVGIATGHDSGVFVMDIDGEDGIASLKALIAEHGKPDPTYTTKTGSGGFHFYFEMPDFDMTNKASTVLGKGIDIRANGGQVVAPPSISKKGPYTIVKDVPIAKAPEWMLELLRPKERKVVEGPARTMTGLVDIPDAERQRLDGYTIAAIDHEVGRLKALHWAGDPSQYPGQPWDITTFEVACNLIQLANADWSKLTFGEAVVLIIDNAPRDPGFNEDRVIAKIDSARKKVGDEPAVYPPKPADLFGLASPETYKPIQVSDSAPVADMQQPVIRNTEAAIPSTDDDFTSVATSAEVVVERPRVAVQAWNGVPVVDGVLDPFAVGKQAAATLGAAWRDGTGVDLEVDEVHIDVAEMISGPKVPAEQVDNLNMVDIWVTRNLRSGTPELLWAALGAVLRGVDVDAPTIVFRGGGPLLAVLARTLAPPVGEENEVMLFGPRISTHDAPGDRIVFEFDAEPADFTPYAEAIVRRAMLSDAPVEAQPPEVHDELARLTDFRIAQQSRSRLGLGSRPREWGEDDFS